MKWKALAACTLAGLALIAAGCGGGDKAAAGGAKAGGQDLKGKKLVMYVSFHEDTAKELADLFKKQTGADVSFIRLPTGEALARITAEKDAPKADIWLGGTADAHAKAAADGLLEAYKSKNAKMIMPEYQDKDGSGMARIWKFWQSATMKNVSMKNLNRKGSPLRRHCRIF